MKNIFIITDSFPPLINGVSTTISNIEQEIKKMTNHTVSIIHTSMFNHKPYPLYPEIHFITNPMEIIKKLESIDEFRRKNRNANNYIHIATEGPLGFITKNYLDIKNVKYTTSYHTQFPEYLKTQNFIPLNISYQYMKWFHEKSKCVLVPSKSVKWKLKERGFKNIKTWSRGVNHDVFHHNYNNVLSHLPQPIFTYFGRISIEKNVEFFLKLNLKGTKLIIGDGPQRKELQNKYPNATFLGYKQGKELAQLIASSSVTIFPSLTDTFGLTIIESMACGIPVTAFDVYGPTDLITKSTGSIIEIPLNKQSDILNNTNIQNEFIQACYDSLNIDKKDCIQYAQSFTWENCTKTLLKNLTNS